MLKKHIIIAIIILLQKSVSAQIDNSYISDDEKLNPNHTNKWGIGINSFSYFRNTEYFNKLETGLTFFGNQLTPTLWLQHSDNIKLRAGIFLNHNFGTNQILPVMPVLSLILNNKKHQFIFGTINGATAHKMLEPIFNIEYAILQRIEQGAQYKFISDYTFFDTWINWQNYLPYKGNSHERFNAGINYKQLLITKEYHKLFVHSQLLLQHKGGQLSADTTPQYGAAQGAFGLELELDKLFYGNNINLAQYIITSNNLQNTNNNGYALMSNLSVNSKHKKYNPIKLVLTYFYGNNFNATNGTSIYQNIPKDGILPIYKNRQLLFLRFLFDKNIIKTTATGKCNISARFEPFYDVNSGKFEHSSSLYIYFNLNDVFYKN